MNYKRLLVWFRNDLRLHDHAALFSAVEKGDEIIPVYCFDPRQFKSLDLGIPKTGSHRAKFLMESVDNLKKKLKELGSDLLVLEGHPEELIPKIAREHGVHGVYFSEEVTSEEKKVEEALESALWKLGIETFTFWQSTLFHMEDLPFPVNQTPEVFTQFRKECEKFSKIRKTYPKPQKINSPNINWGKMPLLSKYGLEKPANSSQAVIVFEGGEDEGIRRLQTYFWENDCLKTYKETRNGLLGADYSSKFSAWLALGCLSPRFIYEEVKRYERERKKNQSTYWLIFELIWRDYFRFIAKKHGNKIFQVSGIKNTVDNWVRNEQLFQKWTEGNTGIPFIDANMRELNATGFMSNRGRQNVASFLVNDLNIDWRWGAAYFESQLIDYDVCSNWGNWMYVAGVGNDPRENRYFNILKQAHNYDRKGEYIRHWIPELDPIQGFDIHQPFELSTKQLKESGVSLGGTYPHPMVKIPKF
ncbi:deoxyribodipyrimidine photo-lyase (single-stranded DNA-specific) [Belliella buryatensis]|uniref:Cryptochrome DASH n=1 Tax=Belliella buryatensis TaxID=1500549 RepID=A0A239BTK5_9BACT|nr:DASH family cryptochrome [Belliella buryatensis]SNS11236.1 deoxyribodipyrimidine photo-lyase (single-stranded DNA-specific) [Belliella buryatensis]